MTDQQPWWNQPAANSSAQDEPTPTRAYDLNVDGVNGQSDASGRDGGARDAAESVTATSRYDTDDLNYARQPSAATRADEPTQVLPAAVPPASQQPGAAAPQRNSPPQWHNPQHAVPQQMPAERDLRAPGYQLDHRGVNVMAVLEEGTGSPGIGARVAAMVIGAILGLVVLFMSVESHIPGSNIMQSFSEWLMSTFSDQLIVAGVLTGIVGLIKLLVVLSSMLSGLAPLVFGVFMLAQGVAVSMMAGDRFDGAVGSSMLQSAIVEAVLFFTLALVVHLVRGSGYRKALRLVRQASRR